MLTEEQIRRNIREAYLINFGNLYINRKDYKILEVEHYYSVKPWSGWSDKDHPPIDITKILNCFEKSSLWRRKRN